MYSKSMLKMSDGQTNIDKYGMTTYYFAEYYFNIIDVIFSITYI